MAKESPQFSLITAQKLTPKRRLISPIVLGPFFVKRYKQQYIEVTGKKHCRMSEVALGWKMICYIDLNGRAPTLKTMIDHNFFSKWLINPKYRRKNELKKIRKFQLQIIMKLNI